MECVSEVEGGSFIREQGAISGNDEGAVAFGVYSRGFGGVCWGKGLEIALLEATAA